MKNLVDRSVELLVVGAGPVGLTAGLCAARRGLRVELIEQNFRGWGRGFAALLHPSSIRIFKELGVAERLWESGHAIHGVVVHADRAPSIRVQLAEPALSVAQARIEEALLSKLRAEGVDLRAPFEAGTLQQEPAKVRVRAVRRELIELGSPADFSSWRPLESSLIEADFVIGADGYESKIRSALGIEALNVDTTEAFAMFEVELNGDFGDDIHIGFSDGLGSMLLPLAGSRVRLGFQLESELAEEPGIERLKSLVRERFPWFQHELRALDWSTVMHFERRLARRFGAGRVWLAGDAAHVTSPFGAQSMNSGLTEVRDLVDHVARCLAGESTPDSLERYGHTRAREWQKLLGFHVKYELLPNAPDWTATYARRLIPALPVSGVDMPETLRAFGLAVV
ncbi:MAG TPA: NAD(P)/FAD-dependent oxidoreductase [Polyangiaceae bacterium]